MERLEFKYNSGGREKYFKGETGDCVCRAVSIATEKDYKEIYDLINKYAKEEKNKKSKSSAREGVSKKISRAILKDLGWEWIPLMKIGSGCYNHLCKDEIPMNEIIIVQVSKHLSCIKNGVINDTYDCSREGTRCVYGYFRKK